MKRVINYLPVSGHARYFSGNGMRNPRRITLNIACGLERDGVLSAFSNDSAVSAGGEKRNRSCAITLCQDSCRNGTSKRR